MKKNDGNKQKIEKNVNQSSRLALIRAHFFDNDSRKMSQLLGINYFTLSKLLNGDRPLRTQHIESLLLTCPQLNSDWLLFGTGEMLTRPSINIGSNAGNVANINNGTQSVVDNRLIDTIANQQHTIAAQHSTIDKQAAQVSQLIALLSDKKDTENS